MFDCLEIKFTRVGCWDASPAGSKFTSPWSPSRDNFIVNLLIKFLDSRTIIVVG